ncbi:MAG: hypothetical protein JXA69_06050 [Phycisphaerae bacterium]|nr:hypothetical protein [Phycisphaerae bacterium]
MTDSIEQLLRAADRAASPPPIAPADLAGHVRRLARRRRTLRAVGGAAAAAMVVLAVGSRFLMPQAGPTAESPIATGPQPATQNEVTQLRAEIAALRQEADAALALARQLAAERQRQDQVAALQRVIDGPDAVDEVRREMDQAAFTIVYQADRMLRELNLPESAIESYRQAIRLFPDSPSAAVARQRLAEIETLKGDQL